MNVKKDEIVDLLRARGEHDKAANVDCVLPRHVDTEADAGLLSRYDVDVSEIRAASSDGEPDTPVAGV